MVGPRAHVHVEAVSDPLWTTAFGLLSSGQAAVGLAGLTLFYEPPKDQGGGVLQVEYPCPVNPLTRGGAPSVRLAELASSGLERARARVDEACSLDPRFATLVAESDLRYEFVYDYGTGTVLVATAGRDEALTWN